MGIVVACVEFLEIAKHLQVMITLSDTQSSKAFTLVCQHNLLGHRQHTLHSQARNWWWPCLKKCPPKINEIFAFQLFYHHLMYCLLISLSIKWNSIRLGGENSKNAELTVVFKGNIWTITTNFTSRTFVLRMKIIIFLSPKTVIYLYKNKNETTQQ